MAGPLARTVVHCGGPAPTGPRTSWNASVVHPDSKSREGRADGLGGVEKIPEESPWPALRALCTLPSAHPTLVPTAPFVTPNPVKPPLSFSTQGHDSGGH